MDALTVLRREHTRTKHLFAEFDALPECACTGRRAIMREIDDLVRRHIGMEEALIYKGACAQHLPVVQLLDEIASMECHDQRYAPRARMLRDVLQQHIDEEEARVFSALAGTTAA